VVKKNKIAEKKDTEKKQKFKINKIGMIFIVS